MLCEQLLLALETAASDIPHIKSILTAMSEGVEAYKPKATLHDQEVKDLLENIRQTDSKVQTDLSGLARVLVKK